MQKSEKEFKWGKNEFSSELKDVRRGKVDPKVSKMSMTGDSEAVLNQIRDIQGKDIPPEDKNALINKILGNRWVLNNKI